MMQQLAFNLFIAHIIGDFYCQTDCSCDRKVIRGFKGRDLWIHAFIIGILSLFSIGTIRGWWIALIIMFSHLLIDWGKSRYQIRHGILRIKIEGGEEKVKFGDKKQQDLKVFLADQFLHLAIIVGCAWWYTIKNDWSQFKYLECLITNYPLWVNTAVAMLLAIKPANSLVLLIMGRCKVKIESQKKEEHGNFHSGELIGWLERGLMLIFVVLSQYEAIGFLVAAKSILRFNDATQGEKSEYVLTGTLLSLAVAVGLGLFALFFRFSANP